MRRLALRKRRRGAGKNGSCTEPIGLCGDDTAAAHQVAARERLRRDRGANAGDSDRSNDALDNRLWQRLSRPALVSSSVFGAPTPFNRVRPNKTDRHLL